jgi:hypothetical protein
VIGGVTLLLVVAVGVVCLVLLNRGGGQQAQQPSPSGSTSPATQPEKPVGPTLPIGWITFRNDTNRFTVGFPARPKESVQPQKTAVGEFDLYLFQVNDPETATQYVVGCTEYTGVKLFNPEDRFDGARDGLLASGQYKLRSERKIELQGSPGREIDLELPDGKGIQFRVHLYLVGQRMYQLMVFSKQDVAKNRDASLFFDSFRLLPEP